MPKFTHAYFPRDRFDKIVINSCRAFGKCGNTYIMLAGMNELIFREDNGDALIQKGNITYWVCELGSVESDGCFDDFINRTEGNYILFKNDVLLYQSRDKKYRLEYGKDFYVDHLKMDTQYNRIDSPYAKVTRKPDSMYFEYDNSRLCLDFHRNIRKV
jgi:hypothetical protein